MKAENAMLCDLKNLNDTIIYNQLIYAEVAVGCRIADIAKIILIFPLMHQLL